MIDPFHTRTCQKTDVYTLVINVGLVTITFVDGKFLKVVYPMTGIYSRGDWRILAAIEEEIIKIEKNYNE